MSNARYSVPPSCVALCNTLLVNPATSLQSVLRDSCAHACTSTSTTIVRELSVAVMPVADATTDVVSNCRAFARLRDRTRFDAPPEVVAVTVSGVLKYTKTGTETVEPPPNFSTSYFRDD